MRAANACSTLVSTPSPAASSINASGLPSVTSKIRSASPGGSGLSGVRSRIAAAASRSRPLRTTASRPCGSSSPGRVAISSAIASANRRRAANRIAPSDDSSTHWASSIVDEQRALLGAQREQAQRRDADQEAVAVRAGREPERAFQRRGLRFGQLADPVQRGPQQRVQAGERDLGLGLDPARLQHGHLAARARRRTRAAPSSRSRARPRSRAPGSCRAGRSRAAARCEPAPRRGRSPCGDPMGSPCSACCRAATVTAADEGGAGSARRKRSGALTASLIAARFAAPRHRRTVCQVLRPLIARVEPLTTTRRLSGPFDYRVDDDVQIGSIVKIPFGHQKLEGVVIGLAETTDVPDEKLVTPTGIRDDSLPRDLVDLALWMAEEYCSTPARALALVTPPPGKAKTYLWAEPTSADGKLTDNQRALLERLPGPTGEDLPALRRLEKRGLVTITPRIARRAPRTNPAPDRERRAHGGAGGRARSDRSGARRGAAAARRDRLGQDRGLSPRGGRGARTRRRRDRARARDRAHAADGGAVRGPVRRHGRAAALRALRRRALRRVAPAALRRGADRGRAALGGVRAGREARADRRRRGARRVLQARGRPALRRPSRRRVPRVPGARAAARRLGHAAPGDRPPDARGCGSRRAWPAAATCRPCACSTCASRSTRSIPRRVAR